MTKLLKNKEKGQATIEFAIVIPIILLLLFVTIESGWYFANYYALKTVAKDAAYEIKEPVNADWESKVGWIEGGTPSWVSGSDLEDYSNYSGWLPFGLSYSNDSVTALKNRVQAKSGLIKLDKTDFTIKGGWLIKTMAENIPAETGSGIRTEPRSEVYYVDIYVSIKYKYKPLSPLGGLIFCRGAGEKEMEAKEKVTYPIGSSS